jgi:hypothetical protein
MLRTARLTDQLIPEWTAFHDAMTARRPDHGTACEAWTVRDIAAHQAGNAEELARILGAHLEGGPVPPTRSFEEREPRYQELDDRALERALAERIAELAMVVDRAMDGDPDALVPWTGRRRPRERRRGPRAPALGPPAGRPQPSAEPGGPRGARCGTPAARGVLSCPWYRSDGCQRTVAEPPWRYSSHRRPVGVPLQPRGCLARSRPSARASRRSLHAARTSTRGSRLRAPIGVVPCAPPRPSGR